MILEEKKPARPFEVGTTEKFMMYDCGLVRLAPNEQVTFVTDSDAEYDVARKEWGFYATPSLNGRLPSFGLRGALVRNRAGRFFVLLVERNKEEAFEAYRDSECLEIVSWLDRSQDLEALRKVARDAR